MPVVVLVIAIGLEGYSFMTAIRESNHTRGKVSWVNFVRRAKAPELPVVLLEDAGALVGLVLALFGVVLTLITGNGVWDGIGTARDRRAAGGHRRRSWRSRRRAC